MSMRDTMNLVEGFQPQITMQGTGEEYTDGSIHSDVTVYDGGIRIFTFSSKEHGKGHGRRALQWMKKTYGHVEVEDPGRPRDNPDSFAFWKKMAEEGLVDTMMDDAGNVIYADGTWTIPEEDEADYEGFIPTAS